MILVSESFFISLLFSLARFFIIEIDLPSAYFYFFHLTNELANLELNDKKDMRND